MDNPHEANSAPFAETFKHEMVTAVAMAVIDRKVHIECATPSEAADLLLTAVKLDLFDLGIDPACVSFHVESTGVTKTAAEALEGIYV